MTASDGTTIRDLYGHNRWANHRVFGVTQELDAGTLGENAPGTHGTMESTLKHLVGVEDVYLSMLSDASLESRGSLESYLAHGLPWFVNRAAEVAEGYRALLADVDHAFLDAPLPVPWFDFPLTKRDGLLQVLSHSAQHRAQVFSVLGAKGIDVPSLDFVVWVGEGRT